MARPSIVSEPAFAARAIPERMRSDRRPAGPARFLLSCARVFLLNHAWLREWVPNPDNARLPREANADWFPNKRSANRRPASIRARWPRESFLKRRLRKRK